MKKLVVNMKIIYALKYLFYEVDVFLTTDLSKLIAT